MFKIESYDECEDKFLVMPVDSDAGFTVDAGSLACLLGRFDEPYAFIDVVFSVQVNQ